MTTINVTESNLNAVLDKVNHSLIRMDRIARELEEHNLGLKFNDEPSAKDLQEALIRVCEMNLEFRETLDQINNLFHYVQVCVESDRIHIDQLAREAKVTLTPIEE